VSGKQALTLLALLTVLGLAFIGPFFRAKPLPPARPQPVPVHAEKGP